MTAGDLRVELEKYTDWMHIENVTRLKWNPESKMSSIGSLTIIFEKENCDENKNE